MQVQLLLPFPETKDGTKGTSGSPSLPGIASLQSLSAAQVILRLSLWDAARGLIPGAVHQHHPSVCLCTHMDTCGCLGIAWEPTEVDGCRRSREDRQGFGLAVALPGCSITRIWGITDFSLCSCSRDGSGRRGELLLDRLPQPLTQAWGTLKLAVFPALISRLIIRHGHRGQRWSQRCWVLGVRGFGQGSDPIVRAGCGKTLPRGAQRRGKCFPNAFPCGLEQLCCLGARLGQRRCLGAAAGRAALGAGGPLPTPGKSAPGVGGHLQGCRGCPALAVSQHSCCGVFWVPGTDLGEAQAKGLWCPGSRGGGEAHEALCDGGCVHAHLSDPKRETA